VNPFVAVIQGKLGRYPSFETSYDKMLEHTLRVTGRLPARTRSIGLNPAEGRNAAVSAFLLDRDSDVLVFCDDDHVLGADTLIRLCALLDGSDYDLAAPLVLKTAAPFQSVAWEIQRGLLTSVAPWGRSGVLDVDEVGTGVLAVTRAVFERLEPPWFRLGQIPGHPAEMMEDVFFSRAARRAGFRIALDIDHVAGHTAPFTVWADPQTGTVLLADGEGHTLAIPAAALTQMPAPQLAAVGR